MVLGYVAAATRSTPIVEEVGLPIATILARNGRGEYYDDMDEYGQGSYGYDDYDDRPSPRSRSRGRNRGRDNGGVLNGWLDTLKNQRQLGAMLLGVGILLTFMGMMLFFEGNLLRLGNICVIAGVFLLIGPNKVGGFFLKESRMQATIITSIGVLLVFWGKPRLGLLIEIFGLLNLFGNMFPMLLAIGKKMPILGDVLSAFDGNQGTGGGRNNGIGGGGRRYPGPRQQQQQHSGGSYNYDGQQHSYDPDF